MGLPPNLEDGLQLVLIPNFPPLHKLLQIVDEQVGLTLFLCSIAS